MTTEEKELLLKDLCARLPYKVNCVFHSKKGDIPATLTSLDYERGIAYIKPIGQSLVYCYFIEEGATPIPYPYLRPMTSMTEEEEEEWLKCKDEETIVSEHSASIDWLLSHHFDYRRLIERGLALEAPKDMYYDD